MCADLPLLSVVSPAFNEENGLRQFHSALTDALEPLADESRVEIVYVDDGSRDATLAVLRQLAAADERVRYLSLTRNFGNQAALTAGLEDSRGDAVVTLDCDMQHPPMLIPALVSRWREGFDVVVAVRATGSDRTQGWLKRNTSKLFHHVLRRWGDVDVQVNATDYRLLSRRAVDALVGLGELHRYLRGLVQWLGFPTAAVPFETMPRVAGTSRYTVTRLVRLAFDGLLSFSRMPIRLAVAGGIGAIALSLVASLFVASARPNDPTLIALLIAVHLVGGIVLAALGVLGAYVVRIFEEAKGRPLYVVKEQGPATARRQPAPSPRRRAAAAA
jgi:glycosyltransferase involved in cell wall biosynthesis